MNRQLTLVGCLMAAMGGAFAAAQIVTPTLANTKLRPPISPVDVVPPAVVSITAQSGAPGTPAMPIAAADPIIITFSKPVTAASLDLMTNFVVRNQNVTTAAYPLGVLVPGFITPLTPGATNDAVYVFTPIGPYGPGVSPAQGFDVEVRIGSFGSATVAPILGLPMGAPPVQLPLSNSLSQVFRTTPCAGCVTPAAIGETFDTTAQSDATFVQTFGPAQARWNAAAAPSQLAGRALSGSPAANTASGLGTRFQLVFDPQPNSSFPPGLFDPFDASAASSGGQCGAGGCNLGINPQGGGHIMHLYEAVDLMSFEDSIEQIEWSPVNAVTAATTYPQYQLWCGVTNKQGAYSGAQCPPPNPVDLCMSAIMDWNYTLLPYQTGQPISGPCASPAAISPRKVLCNGPIPYVVALQTTQWYAFPVLSPCFDYSTSSGQSGPGVNLLIEQNIETGNQMPNFNRYRATAYTPVRRVIDGPLSQAIPGVCPYNHGGGFDIYRMRFTFVGLVAQARSLWYDTGTANPNYLGFVVSPPLAAQPAGTQSTWILEGTDVLNPGPGTNGVSGVYIDAAGNVNPNVLSSVINQLRYFRFRVEFRGNNLTNMAPSYGSVLMGYTF